MIAFDLTGAYMSMLKLWCRCAGADLIALLVEAHGRTRLASIALPDP